METEKKFYTPQEVATVLALSLASVYRLAKEGVLPACKIGRQWRFPKQKVEAWLEQSEMRNAKCEMRNAPESGQSAIRNPQSAIRNPQSAIRNPQSAIRNPQSAIRNPQSRNHRRRTNLRLPPSAVLWNFTDWGLKSGRG
jgi:major type 1 subunit fimbrin (pilin)